MKLKAFNNKHRKLVPVLIYFEIVAIVFVSICGYVRKHLKVVVPAIVAAVVIIVAMIHLSGAKSDAVDASSDIVVTAESTDKTTKIDVETAAAAPEESLESASSVSKEVNKTEETTTAATDEYVEVSEDSANVEASIETSSSDNETKKSSKKTSKIVDTIEIGTNTTKTVTKEDVDAFVQKYNNTVGWLWFEDQRISYPIMRADDNTTYALKDYEGNDSETGAVFLDYRNATDFSDSNSIIYGHNMRNRTMFGALKIYKEDLGFLELHKYFQIITPEETARYEIFAFMDVPKDSYIYDVVGKNPSNMREYLDTIEYKTYIDTGIEPGVDDQIVMLSSCTKSDELYFVIFAVKIKG